MTRRRLTLSLVSLLLVMVCRVPMALALTATLTWNANTEPDLAGYHIYRMLADCAQSGPLQQIGSVGLVTTYSDATIPAGTLGAHFEITAFDNVGNESLRSNRVCKAFAPGAGQSAIVTGVVTDATWATVTIQGPGQVLEFIFDTQPTMTNIPTFVPGTASFRHDFVWPQGTTFACYRTKGTDEVYTEQGCNSVTPGPPALPAPTNLQVQ